LANKEGILKKWSVILVVLCCGLASQNALAQANLGLKTAGFQVGVVSPENSDATLGFGGFADWGTLTPNIHLVSHLDYWSKSESSPFGEEVSVRDVALSMRGKYMFAVSSPKFQPFAGLGLGMHFLNARVEVPGFPTAEDSSTKLGMDFGGGFTSPLSPKTDLQAEMWYGIVDNFSQLSVKAGMAFKLGM
jgi:hypothetical protein